MQRELYKELWLLRFQKMLQLEEESVKQYENLLEESQKMYKNDIETQDIFKKLIVDEQRHAKLVQELLNIVDKQPD